jgi:predicted O-methyltransferase YrrM
LAPFRKLLRNLPFYSAYKALGHYPDYWYWKLRGQPVRSPHLVKQRAVREYAQRYGLRTMIETGTYYGEMVAAVRGDFDCIYSIEFDPQLARRASRRFASDSRIHILEGDSQKVLPELLKSISEPALFWLDAGYWGWVNLARDPERLSAEVEAALSHAVKGHVVLMDDARMLDGRNGAPTFEQLRERITARFPGRRIEVLHDIIRITPS